MKFTYLGIHNNLRFYEQIRPFRHIKNGALFFWGKRTLRSKNIVQIRPALLRKNTNRKVVKIHRALVMATHSAASSPSPPICCAMG